MLQSHIGHRFDTNLEMKKLEENLRIWKIEGVGPRPNVQLISENRNGSCQQCTTYMVSRPKTATVHVSK
jgi:hypothetical protein